MKKLPFVLSKNEVLEIISKEKNLRNRFFMRFLLFTGTRISEALNVKLADINFKDGVLKITKAKRDKQRLIIIAEEFLKELKLLGPEFIPFSFGRFQGWRIIKEAGLKNNKPELHPHTFRHIHGTTLSENGADPQEIAEQLGHTNLNTTRIYRHLSVEHRKKVTKF